jgi:large subunit ribosomal protein L9
MEILLLQDVAGIGKKNDLLVVGDGFALNCLLPQRKALVATPTVRKRYADQIKKRAEEKETEKQSQQQAAAALAGKSIRLARKASKTGKLYAAVTEQIIADSIKEQLQFDLSADDIILPEHIKTVGTHQVQLKIGAATQSLSVMVSEEK